MKCINNKPLQGNDIAPPLMLDRDYELKMKFLCDCGLEHWDVGLKSRYNYISCY